MTDIILIAIPEEAPSLQKYKNVIFTGVGKVNATMTAMSVVENKFPNRIINFGTAGGITVSTGLHECKRFIQRDMDCTGLGFKLGETPFDLDYDISLGKGLTCGSGDNFVTEKLPVDVDLVDMEAYAIAKVCKRKKIDFRCFKYISDEANDSASKDWKQNMAAGERFYIQTIEKLKLQMIG